MAIDIEINDELEILCILSGSRDCPSRERLINHFGYKIDIECPAKKLLKKNYDKWKAGKRENYEKS